MAPQAQLPQASARRFNVGIAPGAVAVNALTNQIYVANQNSSNVTVIDGITNATTSVPAGSAPKHLAVNPVSNKIYVANESGNNLTVIDGATNSTLTVTAGTHPLAVGLNSVTNKIYVGNGDNPFSNSTLQ